MREETIGEARLILSDCRDVLASLAQVEAVVTDPPYGTGWKKGSGKPIGEFSSKRQRANWDKWRDDWVAMCRATRFAIFCPTKKLVNLMSCFDQCQLRYYIKTNPRPGLGGADSPSVEPIVCAPNVKNGTAQYFIAYNGDNLHHPTEKPVAVMNWLVAGISDPHDMVLDPFMGSGTTGVACLHLGRRFIGIEREQKYFDVACRRLEEALRQDDLPGPKSRSRRRSA